MVFLKYMDVLRGRSPFAFPQESLAPVLRNELIASLVFGETAHGLFFLFSSFLDDATALVWETSQGAFLFGVCCGCPSVTGPKPAGQRKRWQSSQVRSRVARCVEHADVFRVQAPKFLGG